MSDTALSDLGGTLTPAENAYFESGGNSDVPMEKVDGAEKPEAAETEAPAATTEKKEEPKAEKVVPLAALHEARGELKSVRDRMREMELENARYKERFDLVARLQQQNEAPPPNPEEDFIGAVRHDRSELERVKQILAQQDQERAQSTQRQQLVSAYTADAADFSKENADFREAYSFLLESRARELEAIGYSDPAQRAQALQNDELAVVAMAMQSGKRPAQSIYDLAKARGYAKKAEEKLGVDAAAKLDAIEKGQAANKSLSSAGGSSGGDAMTAEKLLAMPMGDFEAWCNKNPRKARELMGG